MQDEWQVVHNSGIRAYLRSGVDMMGIRRPARMSVYEFTLALRTGMMVDRQALQRLLGI